MAPVTSGTVGGGCISGPPQTKSALADLARFKAHFDRHHKMRVFDAHLAKVHSVNWNMDGRRLASGSFDKTVVVFNLDNMRLTKDHTFRGHQQQVDQLCWHPTHPDQLASAGGDKTVRLWDARARKGTASISTKGENINIVWSPDGKTLAVGNKDDLVQFIDLRTQKIVANEQFKTETNELTWNNQGTHLLFTQGSGQIMILSWPDLKQELLIQAHPASIVCIKCDPSGRYFSIGAADAIVSIWDARWLVCLRTVCRLDWPIRAVSFSHDGQLLASGSEDLWIDIAHTETGERVCEIRCDNPTFSIAWHPREYLLAFGVDDKSDTQGLYGSRASDRDIGSIRLYGIPSSDSSQR